MAKFGKCQFNDLKKFQEKLNKFGQQEIQLFIESCAKELAARLLAKVIRRTPVGEYPKGAGKKGGTLRRGWTAGKNQSATAYVQSLTIDKVGKAYVIEITNPVDYAVYVEFGHRTRNHKGWVQGKFMLTISEEEIGAAAPKILEQKLTKKLREVFG